VRFDFALWAVPLDVAVFLAQFFGHGGLGFVLLDAGSIAGFDQGDGLQDRVGPELGEAVVQALGGFAPVQCDRFLEQDVAGVEALVHPHDGDARLFFARGDCGVDGRSAAIFRQQ
jgi:hypothetical protein